MECWNTSIMRQIGEMQSRTFWFCVAELKQCAHIQGFFVLSTIILVACFIPITNYMQISYVMLSK